MPAMSGEYVWNVRSTPSPDEILRTTNEELRPRLRLAITTPSYACTRLRSPSTTFTLTTTVSPLEKSGIALPNRFISSFSGWLIKSMAMLLRSVHRARETACSYGIARSGREKRERRRYPVSWLILPLKFFQQRALVRRESAPFQQIRPALPCPAQCLLQPPAGDFRVIA